MTRNAAVEGFELTWLGANSLSLSAGYAFVEGLKGYLFYDGSTITPSPAGAGWLYLYLYAAEGGPYDVGRAGAIEVSSVAPAAPYYGEARSKSGDTTRRYIPNSAFRASAANTVLRFRKEGPWTFYGENVATTLQTHSALSNTTYTGRDLTSLVPPTSRRARVWFNCNANAGAMVDPHPEEATSLEWQVCRFSTTTEADVPLTSGQFLRQKNTAASGATDLAVLGYMEEVPY
jgi:hypothetical protein